MNTLTNTLSAQSEKTLLLLKAFEPIKNKDGLLTVKSVLDLLKETPTIPLRVYFPDDYNEIKESNLEEKKDWLSLFLSVSESPHRLNFKELGKYLNILSADKSLFPFSFKGAVFSQEDIRTIAHCLCVDDFYNTMIGNDFGCHCHHQQQNLIPIQKLVEMAKEFKSSRPKNVNKLISKKIKECFKYNYYRHCDEFSNFLMSELSDYLLKNPHFNSVYLFDLAKEPYFSVEFEDCRDKLEQVAKNILEETDKNGYAELKTHKCFNLYMSVFSHISDNEVKKHYFEKLINFVLSGEPVKKESHLFCTFDVFTGEIIERKFPIDFYEDAPYLVKQFVNDKELSKEFVSYDMLFSLKDDFFFSIGVLKFAEFLPLTEELFAEIQKRNNPPILDALYEMRPQEFPAYLFEPYNGKKLFNCLSDINKLMFLCSHGRKFYNNLELMENETSQKLDDPLAQYFDKNSANNIMTLVQNVAKDDSQKLILLLNKMVNHLEKPFNFFSHINDMNIWEEVIIEYGRQTKRSKQDVFRWLLRLYEQTKDETYTALMDKVVS